MLAHVALEGVGLPAEGLQCLRPGRHAGRGGGLRLGFQAREERLEQGDLGGVYDDLARELDDAYLSIEIIDGLANAQRLSGNIGDAEATIRQAAAASQDIAHMHIIGREARPVESRGHFHMTVDPLLPQNCHPGTDAPGNHGCRHVVFRVETESDRNAGIIGIVMMMVLPLPAGLLPFLQGGYLPQFTVITCKFS